MKHIRTLTTTDAMGMVRTIKVFVRIKRSYTK